ncbi:MAG: hypothetical protein KC442_13310 [Thermomicrobiales bacterium]|nr:hypothetical protein [Thermomicrobiales bacterium]
MTASAVAGPATGSRRVPANSARLQTALPHVLLALVMTVCLALASTSPPRRTGDAHQYLAMALQLEALRPPSLSPADQAALTAWIEEQPPDSGFAASAAALRQPALIRDGRQEFSHFWLYPLLASPALAMTQISGAHPIAAFLVTNSLLVIGALLAVTRTFGVAAALCLLATPVIWFLPRAQVELFMFAFITLAVCAAARGWWVVGALALAVAATQNLPVAAGVIIFWAMGVLAYRAQRSGQRVALANEKAGTIRLLAVVATTCTLALLHPAYYLWRLGVATPQQLNGGIAGMPPNLTRYLAPLLDPDIGMAWWMPVPVVATVAGVALVMRRPGNLRPEDQRLLVACAGLSAWLMFAVAQTTNINSGGRVHVSRYTLWLLPLLLPFLAPALRFAMSRAPRAFPALLAAICLLYAHTFQPEQPERYVEFSPQSRWLMEHATPLYRPLPEIFVERALHTDGGPRLSAVSADCRIMYLASASPPACPLEPDEAADVASRFARGDTALWLRRDGARLPGEPAIAPVAP